MAFDLFEEVVGSWLQTKGYFIMSNIKYYGNKEIDILATKIGENKVIHIEVSCSSNPRGIFGVSNLSAKDYKTHALSYLEKKYFNKYVEEKIKELTNCKDILIERIFVHAKVKPLTYKQLEIFREKGVETVHINDIIKEITNSKKFVGDNRMKQLFDIMDTNLKN